MSGDGGYTSVLPVHSTCRAAAMPPSQNAGSSGIVRSLARHEEDRRQRPRLGGRPPTGRARPPSGWPCCPRCRRRRRRRRATPPARRRRAARRRARRRRRRAPAARRPVVPTRRPSASSSQTERRCGALESRSAPRRASARPGSAASRFCREVAAQEPARADEDLGVARAEDVRQLGRRRQRADRRDERADAQRGVERREAAARRRAPAGRSACPCRRRSRAAPAPCGPSADRARRR